MPSNTREVKSPFADETFTYSEEDHAKFAIEAVARWQKSQEALKAAEQAEMENRKWVAAFLHNPEMTGKQETVKLGNGNVCKLKVPQKYSFVKIDDKKIDKAAIEKALSKIEKDGGEAGELIASRLVNWKPELSLTEYKQLPEKMKKIIDTVIVVSEGTPVVSVEPEKVK